MLSGNVVDLICEKYKKKVKSEKVVCEHLEEYCKFRGACIINLMTCEDLREKRRSTESEKECACHCPAEEEKNEE